MMAQSHPQAADLTASDFAQTCICQAVRRLARQVSKHYEDAFRPLGLKAGQFTILAALKRDRPVRLGALANGLGMDRTTLTRDLRPLERRGLVTSTADPSDARARCIALTERGRDLLERAIPLWRTAQADLLTRMQNADLLSLRAQIDRLAS